MYRKDGLCSSHLFKLWPIALKDSGMGVDDLDVPKMFTPTPTLKRRYKPLKIQKQRRKTIQSIDEIFYESSSGDLQSSKLDNVSKSQPILVSIDTSGAGFQRMASLRRSMKEEAGYIEREKRRRRTVIGVPENIMQEIEQFEKSRHLSKDRTRKYSLDDLDQKNLDAKDEVMQQYLQDIESAIAEREEEEYAEQREAKLLKFLPCRRSRSLPRCIKLISGSHREGWNRSSLYQKKHQKGMLEELKLKQFTEETHAKFTSSLSLGSQRSSRSSKRSSIIGEKIKSLVNNTLKPRPKSMDFDLIDTNNDEDSKSKIEVSKTMIRSSSLTRTDSPNMPEGISRATSNESQIGPGTYYYFNNTLPRAQAKKYDFPWDSLPKDWTTSVKLREISKRRKEDRQSSSGFRFDIFFGDILLGNWSQSGYSSNRQSVDSDVKSSQPSTLSQYSVGKDSGRDSLRYSGERDGLDTGYMGDAASNESISDTKSTSNTDSDEWIKSLAERAANRGDVTSTSAEALANLSRLTKQNIRNLDILVPGRRTFPHRRNDLEDDGESSVYSLDTEGFYTSFHNDSGLKRSTNTLLDEEDIDDRVTAGICDTKCFQSMVSFIVHDRDFLKPFDDDGSDTLTSTSSVSAPNLSLLAVKKSSTTLDDCIPMVDPFKHEVVAKDKNNRKPPPPQPPPRVSSKLTNNHIKPNTEETSRLSPVAENTEASSESSDHEVIYARLKKKTSISVHGFPSLCVGLTSDEDDVLIKDQGLSASQERLKAESTEVEEMFLSGKDSWVSGTLPRSQMNANSQSTESTNSWPRLKRPYFLHSGILKTPEKDKMKSSVNPKILNFDPVVNFFDTQSRHSVQLPLSRLSSSDESASSPTNDNSAFASQSNIPSTNKPLGSLFKNLTDSISKYQPAVSTHSDSKQFIIETLIHPNSLSTQEKDKSPIFAFADSSDQSDLSTCSSNLSTIHCTSSVSLTSFDSFDMSLTIPLVHGTKSGDALSSSSSTIALSDIDTTSFTHVTMATDLSLSGSSLSLNWDTSDASNTAPLITPISKSCVSNVNFKNSLTNNVDTNYDSVSTEEFQDRSLTSLQRSSSKQTLVSSSSYVSANQTFTYADSAAESHSTLPQNLATSEKFYEQNSQPFSESYKRQNIGSDKNNNKTKGINSTYCNNPTSSLGQVYSSFTNQLLADHETKWKAEAHQATSSSRKDRRRSNPLTSTTVINDSNSPAFSGGSGSGSSLSNKDVIRRRKSGTDAYSPADSGFGSPSVFSQFGFPPNSEESTFESQVSKMPQIKKAMHVDSITYSIQKAANGSDFVRPDFPLKALSSIPSQSEESLNSQYSVTSTIPLIGKVQKTDLSQPVLHSGTSSESLQSTSSAGRSDSYRVALMGETDQMKLINKKTLPTNSSNSSVGMKPNEALSRFAQSRSLTVPSSSYNEDNIGRADSYRCAVGNSMNAQLGDFVVRNSSYRLATNEETTNDNRMDACNLWTGKTGGSRDIRRMGITDVDQLKHYRNETENRNSSNTLHAKKMLGVKTDNDVNTTKNSPSEQKKILRQSSKEKAKQQKTQSSTYIRFDPIFESGEDLRASSESLRPPSIVSIKTLASPEAYNSMLAESAKMVAQRSSSSTQMRRRSTSQGRKSSEEKSGLTLFDSIKTTLKSISGYIKSIEIFLLKNHKFYYYRVTENRIRKYRKITNYFNRWITI
ncbi:hypothetical protein Btru_077172 [Bulinus truncatus]|nr:hypothetical protein Btru_077172 [Bulinus truncatus]